MLPVGAAAGAAGAAAGGAAGGASGGAAGGAAGGPAGGPACGAADCVCWWWHWSCCWLALLVRYCEWCCWCCSHWVLQVVLPVVLAVLQVQFGVSCFQNPAVS